MRKLRLFSIVLIASSLLISCEQKKIDDFDLSKQELIKAGAMTIEENITSYPVSDADITPNLIPGENRGGNRTCEEVAEAFLLDPDYFMCGDKIDYEEGDFAGAFPEGLYVATDGTYVSFDMDDCLEIDGKFYKVGAVTVKGSDQANVYWYPEGSMGDGGLASPINASNGSAGLSNLTFCFVECEQQEEFVIALKCFFKDENSGFYSFGVSTGEIISTQTGEWCADWQIGYNIYNSSSSSFIIHRDALTDDVGVCTISDGLATVTLNEGLILEYTQIFVGPLSELNDNPGSCPNYISWIYNDDSNIIPIP